jgi:glycosyltransferase involved in cell wall biosynthesis
VTLSPPIVVSVIIPTCNRVALLPEALASVLGQDLDRIEVLVIDDGSSDGTAAWARTVDDPRVRFFHQQRQGRSAARNRGLAAARGEYLALLDDDDLFLPGKLARQSAYLAAHPGVDLVASGVQIVALETGRRITTAPWRSHPALTREALLTGCRLHTCAVMFRRRLLTRMAPWFDPALALAEDWDFYLRAAAAGAVMAWLPATVALYRLAANHGRADAIGYMLSARAVLDRFFAALRDEPVMAESRRVAIYARHDFLTAMRAYGAGLGELGRRFLDGAARADLYAGQGEDALVGAIGEYMRAEILDSQESFVDLLLTHLPAPLLGLAARRQAILAAGQLPEASQ